MFGGEGKLALKLDQLQVLVFEFLLSAVLDDNLSPVEGHGLARNEVSPEVGSILLHLVARVEEANLHESVGKPGRVCRNNE